VGSSATAAGASVGAIAGWAAVDVAIWGYAFYSFYQLLKEWPSNVPVVTAADLNIQLSGSCEEVGPNDPNFIAGPSGSGAQNFVADAGMFPYAVNFENQPTASAPALVVTVTQQLDSHLDWSTFQLGTIAFGNFTVQVPPGLQHYSTRVDATASLGCFVDVTADLNRLTGVVTCTFTTIDPTTLDVPKGNPSAGFLPPDDASQRGEGWFSYTIDPLPSLPTGTVINAKATVTFDAGLPDQSSLDTAPIFNTIDAGSPTSSVASLPAFSPASFTVSWAGQDDANGSGIASYDVYVSDNNGPFALWQSATTQTSAAYTGQDGHTYGFYSIARDQVGNVQPTPSSAQAITTITTSTTTTLQSSGSPAVYGQTVTFTATVSAVNGSSPTGSVDFMDTTTGNDLGTFPFNLVGGVEQASVDASGLVSGSHTIAAAYLSNSAAFSNSTSAGLIQSITPATLTVTANNASVGYGSAALPTFTATITGFVNGDTASVVSGTPNLTTTATNASPVGSYTITAALGTLSASNYTFAFVNSTLTITPAHLAVTADSKAKTYGSANPALTFTLSGFVNGDTAAVVSGSPTLTTTAATGSAVGAYAITVVNAGTLSATNYDFPAANFVNGTLSITPAHLTVTADNKAKTYGSANPALTFTLSGFVNGDTAAVVSGSPTLTTTAATGSAVGAYAITVVNAGTLSATNYDFPAANFANGTLSITPAHLTVTANSPSKTYGSANPALTFTYSGLVNGDTSASFTGALSTSATNSSNVGTYGIVQNTLAATGNYTISSFNQGTLTINPATSTTSVSSSTGGTSSSGQAVTFNAVVTSNGPASVNEGSVSFYIDGSTTAIDTEAVSGGQATSIPISTLAVGGHSITAVYADSTPSAANPNIKSSQGSTTQTVVGNQVFTVVTSAGLAQFDSDPNIPGNQLRLIDVQNSGSGYEMNTSNPGQFGDNAFFSGTAGTAVNLTLTIPYPFITKGSVPIHVYSSYTLSGAPPSLSITAGTDVTTSFAITTAGGHKTGSGAAAILLGDYSPQNLGSTTTVTVKGVMPSTGTMYVNVHLAYGLTTTTGWTLGASYPVGGATYIDAVNSGLGVTVHAPAGSGTYAAGQPYPFSVASGSTVLGTDTTYSENVFKKSVGVAGSVVSQSAGLPLVGATLTLYGPNSSTKVAATATTDSDGAYYLNYKYTGSSATFVVRASAGTWSQNQTITLKANGFQIVNFVDGNAQLAGGWSAPSGGTGSLNQADLRRVLASAETYWARQGASRAQLEMLANSSIQIADLPPDLLGQLVPGTNVIQISRSAAGLGWFTDPQASPPAGAFDLLTVVAHELGHLLGFADIDRAGDVESTYLAPGVRQLNGASYEVLLSGTTGSLWPAREPADDRVPSESVGHSLSSAAIAPPPPSNQFPRELFERSFTAEVIASQANILRGDRQLEGLSDRWGTPPSGITDLHPTQAALGGADEVDALKTAEPAASWLLNHRASVDLVFAARESRSGILAPEYPAWDAGDPASTADLMAAVFAGCLCNRSVKPPSLAW
jgi:hypothetical protein